MTLSRRGLLKFLGIGAAASPVATAMLAETPDRLSAGRIATQIPKLGSVTGSLPLHRPNCRCSYQIIDVTSYDHTDGYRHYLPGLLDKCPECAQRDPTMGAASV